MVAAKKFNHKEREGHKGAALERIAGHHAFVFFV
jgi:hypothetical protein